MLKNVKNTTFPGLLDLFIPHSCRGCGHIGNVLCNRCKNNIIKNQQNICPNCKKFNPTGKCPNCKNLPPTFIAGKRDDLLGTLIHDFKYHSTRALATPLAEILDASLPDALGNVVIVPLPTISRHIRQRGLDHTYLIAKKFARLRGSRYHVAKIITRANNSVQVGSSKSTRKSQAQKAYQLTPNVTIDPNITYILFDDVWTTGASLRAAYQLLKSAGAKNIVLSILALSE